MTLAHSLVTAEDASPDRWMLFLHGILGSRSNWRAVARRFVEARSGWGAVLVDLREHGDSRGLPPPHTVESAARDLVTLEGELDGAVRGVLGHSFGGKVALAYAELRGDDLEELWVVDSNPGARPEARGSEGTVAVVEMLDALPRRWSSREDFVQRIVDEGHDQMLGRWLAMNLERDDQQYRFVLDLDAVRALLDDYFARDLWSVVEDPPGELEVHVVVAEGSSVFDDDDRRRARRAAEHQRVHAHFVAGGHWLHVEAPDALLDLLAS